MHGIALDPLEMTEEVLLLSSGTLAGMMGTQRYTEIDAGRDNWLAWILGHDANKRWTSWIDCWEEYKGEHNGP